MYLKSQVMASRFKELATINEDNKLTGKMNPLRLFFSPLGVDTTSANTGLWHFKDAINGLISQTGTGTAVVGNKMINTTIFNPLLEPSGSFDPVPVNAILQLDTSTDILIILSGGSKSDTNQTNSFNIRDFDTGGFIGARSRVGAAAQGARFTDDSANDVQVTSTNTTAADQALVVAIDRDVDVRGYRMKAVAGLTEDSVANSVTNTDGITFLSTPEISINSDAYAAAVYYFKDGLPPNWRSEATWLAWQWSKQNYVAGPKAWEDM